MKFPIVTRRRAQSAVDVATAGLRYQLDQAREEASAARRSRYLAEARCRELAEQVAELTAANQSYDKPVQW